MWDLCFAYIPLHTFLCDASETKREAVRFPHFTFSCWLYSAGRMGWDAGFSWQCVWHNFTLFIADSEGCCNRHILLACLLRQVVNAELPLWGNHNLILRFSSERIMLPGMFPCDPAAESAEFPVSLTRCLVPGRQPPSQALSTLSTSAGPISTKRFTELLSMYCTAQAARTLLMKRWTNTVSAPGRGASCLSYILYFLYWSNPCIPACPPPLPTQEQPCSW